MWDEIARLTVEHVWMTLIAVAAAVAIGLPAGVFVAHQARYRPWIVGLASVIQTIPSLALFGFLIPIPLIGGIGKRTAVIALVLYALLPVVRSTLSGIQSIDRAVLESARAMGMSEWQLIREVELPLASRGILSGIRIAAVTTIGTATIAAAIGAGGLGTLVFRGLATVDTQQILAGAVPAAVLALLTEGSLEWVERRIGSY
jgi:osmoprotectant transport system permease protein